MLNRMKIRFVRWYLRLIYKSKYERSLRLEFTNSRLKSKHHNWLHFSSDPCDGSAGDTTNE